MRFESKLFSRLSRTAAVISAAVLIGAAGLTGSPIGQTQGAEKAAAAPSPADAGQVRVASRIASVTVYADRAQVFRKGQADVNADARALLLNGLPAALIPGSVRVSGGGTARVKILGVEVASEYLEAEKMPEVRKLVEEIGAVESEISALKGQETVWEAQERFLNSFGTAWSGQASKDLAAGRPDLAGVDKFMDYFGSRLQSIQKGRRDNEKLMAEKKARLEALNRKLKEVMPAGSREEKRVAVLIEVSQPGRLEIDLSYAVSPARWTPVYTFKALPESGEMEMTVSANVTQRTGENWQDVKLVLSTSAPTAGNQPGELRPWYLDFAAARPMKSMTEDMAVRALAAEAAPAIALEETAEAVETWAGVNFEVKKGWTVLSDGTERRVPIDSQKLPASFNYLAVPKLQELAYLRCAFKNTLGYPLLPGKADLFIGQEFVGSSGLDFVPADDELNLFFGEDRQIKVKRELLKREKSGPGFMGRTEKVSLAYRLTLENLRNRPVEVELLDQVPVSQNTRIEVKDVKIVPPPAGQDEAGILNWKVKIEPGKKQEFSLAFSVEYPKGSRLQGI